MTTDIVEQYASLGGVLNEAYQQASMQKGRERHANGRVFEEQPILVLARLIPPSAISGLVQQVCKKVVEASGMAARGEHERAVEELKGAIVYAASGVIRLRELPPPQQQPQTAPDDFLRRLHGLLLLTAEDLSSVGVDLPPDIMNRFRVDPVSGFLALPAELREVVLDRAEARAAEAVHAC